MSDSQKALLCHTVAFDITGNWFHSAVSAFVLVNAIWVYNLVIVQIPHGPVMFALSIKTLNYILTSIQSILCECRFPKTGHTEETVSENRTHAGHNASIFLYA
ncbi:Hypothetical predicted protein [Xyrichtys novacula]|uniref:Uncharacterized protein n=1 Tax=Xyrichtys novacula TaxID=13765 RepID=A0AAV1EXL5_XYRNO|nr:Hypothetical predicted protein [Xyrichtys novacula]